MNPREEEDKDYKSIVYKLYPNSSQERIRDIASSDSYGGSLTNIIRDMEYGSREQPCWTQALTSPKNQFPSHDDDLMDHRCAKLFQ